MPQGGCQQDYNTASCDDLDDCSSLDRCREGVCVGGETDRDSDSDGYLDESCPGGDDCDDGNAGVHPNAGESLDAGGCDDFLDNDCDGHTDTEDLECLSCTSDNQCDDGLFCTGAESCQVGLCVSAGDPCGGQACDEEQGRCTVCGDGVVSAGEDCDPGEPLLDHCCDANGCGWAAALAADPQGVCTQAPECQNGVCDGNGGCTEVDQADGTPCLDDGLFCSGSESCQAGLCVSPGDPCGGQVCDEESNACQDVTWYGLGGSDFGPWDEYLGGSSWGGGISANAGTSEVPSLALDFADNPVAAWEDDTSGNLEIYVRRYDGSEWVEIGIASGSGGGISANAGGSSSPSLALDSGYNPVVAWEDDTSGNLEIYVKRYDGSAWVEVGFGGGDGISANAGGSYNPSITLDGSGNTAVAWVDDTSGNDEIYVKRYDGSAWVDVGTGSGSGGGISANAGGSYNPSITLDGSGNPVVAWHDRTSGNSEIYVKRYDGSQWVEVGVASGSGGGISANADNSGPPALVLDGMGNPVVAWEWDSDGLMTINSEIYVKRYDGSEWVEVGVGSASGGGISANALRSENPSLALDGAGYPIVVWGDKTPLLADFLPNSEIYIKRYDGSVPGGTWVEVGGAGWGGGISANAGGLWGSCDSSLVLDFAGNPVVTWSQFAGSEVCIRRYDGSAWVEVGVGSGGCIDASASFISHYPSLALDFADNPVVAWQDSSSGNSEIYLKRHDGAEWVEVGIGSAFGEGVSANAGASSNPSLALDLAGNPVVAWEDGTSGNLEIYLKSYDGNEWVEIGIGSASGGGISANAGGSSMPSLALDFAGNPVVAWQDSTPGNLEIYIKRYDGSEWVEVGIGSGSGGGISANAGGSSVPSLVLDSADNPVVAWQDGTPGNLEIYLKRYDGSVPGGTWVEVGVGSASRGGISANVGDSYRPSLALDFADNPVVAWYDNMPGNSEIYVRRYDGSVPGGAWVEIGANSAAAGGISNSSAPSSAPSLVTGGERICVSWQEAGITSIEIVLRCSVLK